MNILMSNVVTDLISHRIQKNIRFHLIVYYMHCKYSSIPWESYDDYKDEFYWKDCKRYIF